MKEFTDWGLNIPNEKHEALFVAAFNEIFGEYVEAIKKHPDWSAYDVVHRISKMVEEAGEALQIANDIHESGGVMDNNQEEKLIREIAQAGAMTFRNLIHVYLMRSRDHGAEGDNLG